MGRFLITRAFRTEKKKTNVHIEAKNAIGGQLQEEKKSVRAEDQKSSHPDTEHKSNIRQPKLEGRKPKNSDLNRTLQIEPRRFDR